MTNHKKIEVMVHPFDCDFYDEQESFVRAKAEKLRGSNDLLILASNPEQTRKAIGDRDAIIMNAWDYNAEPVEGWRIYNSRLENYEEVIISGAELHLDKDGKPYQGCVLHAFERTETPNKRIDVASCYIERKAQ